MPSPDLDTLSCIIRWIVIILTSSVPCLSSSLIFCLMNILKGFEGQTRHIEVLKV